MRRIALAFALIAALGTTAGCSSEGTAPSDLPGYIQDPASLTETLSVAHITIDHPVELEPVFVGASEFIYDDGSSCTVTTGQFFSEDGSIVFTVDEYAGRSLADARAEVELEMSLPDRYDELDDATKAVVDHTEWVSLEEAEDGFVLTKTYDGVMMAVFRYIQIGESDHACVMGSFPIEWNEACPGFFRAVFDSVGVADEVSGFPGGTWIPTEVEPAYVDEDGVVWGYWYHPEGEPDYVRVSPDMLYVQGDGGVAGYLNVAEFEAAVEAASAQIPDEPGSYDIEVTSNIYAFLSDEVVGTRTEMTVATQPAETPEESANVWIPADASISTTPDGLTWGLWTADGTTDMEFVMATDTGRYGYIVAADRIAAEGRNWSAFMGGVTDPTVELDVFLYGSKEVVGKYAVTLYS